MQTRMILKYILTLSLLALFVQPAYNQPRYNKQRMDRQAEKAPSKWQQDLPRLTTYLIEPAENDFEKVRAIYTWITLNISYDHQVIADSIKRINKNIGDILGRRKAICMGYAALFKQMCQLAEVEAVVVDGYSKGTATSVPDLSAPDHSWNAVKIAEDWYLLDATWGSSLLQRDETYTTINEDYFLSPPQDFILTHLPNLPMWQLLNCPIKPNHYVQDAQGIQAQIDTCAQSYIYKDSIASFLALSLPNRNLAAATIAYDFNPTARMQKYLGHALMDYAGILSDSLDYFDTPSQLETIVRLQHRIIGHCERAAQLTSLNNWQKELWAGALINQVVAFFQQNQAITPLPHPWKDLIIILEQAQGILADTQSSYFTQMANQQCEEYISILKDYAR